MTDPQAWRSHHAKMRGEDIEAVAKYFASAGSLWDADQSSRLMMLPYCDGKLLRHFWKKSRSAVRPLVAARAFELMEAEFGRGAPARNFDGWPTPERRELYALCANSGCAFYVDDHGNVLPHGWTMENYREKAREHLANLERE